MNRNRKLTAVSSAVMLTVLTACGGGGGGEKDNTPSRQFTTLPTFLQGIEAQCTFTENGSAESLVEYTGTLSNVTELSCSDVSLNNVDGVVQLSALVKLDLENSNLRDISALQSSSLTELNLAGNPIADVNALSGLSALTILNLKQVDLVDVSPLQSLTELESLNLSYNYISDVTGLGNLLKLTELNLAGNNITDISPLAALTQLKELDLSGNNNLACIAISDLNNALAGAVNIAVPSVCTDAKFISASSEDEQTIDNASLATPITRIVISDISSVSDVELFQSGDDLEIKAMTSVGKKQLVVSGWFIEEENQISEFEIAGEGVLNFEELRNLVGLGLYLTEGQDTYTGSDKKDIIYGLGEADFIAAGKGSDTIVGGKGDDILSDYILTFGDEGYYRNTTSIYDDDNAVDTFIYGPDDGNDTLYLYDYSLGNRDRLTFIDDIEEEDITLYRDGLDLKFQLSESDSVVVKGWFKAGDNLQLGTIQFATATPVDAREWVKQKGYYSTSGTIDGTPNADVLYGSDEGDVIIAGKGADTIIGGKGDDILSDNYLALGENGYYRNTSSIYDDDDAVDTFVYNIGDGNDTLYLYDYSLSHRDLLQFAGEIGETDIKIYREGSNLIFFLSESDSVTVLDWFTSSKSQRLGTLQFGNSEPVDATKWVNSHSLTLKTEGTLEGTEENQLLQGTVGNDVVIAGKGVDTIIGGKGDDIMSDNYLALGDDGYYRNTSSIYDDDDVVDTFVYDLGDGNDTLYLYDYSLSHRDLLQFAGEIEETDIKIYQEGSNLIFYLSATDSVTVLDWFTNKSRRLGQLQFGDNEATDATKWVNSHPLSLKIAGTLKGTEEDQRLEGTSGNDVIIADKGSDTIIGGKGDDILSDNYLILGDDGYYRNTSSIYDDDNAVDTFIYNMGDGNDTLYLFDYGLTYRDDLKFGAGISVGDVTAERKDNDLVLNIEGSGSITILKWFDTDRRKTLGKIWFDGVAAKDAEGFVDGLLNP